MDEEKKKKKKKKKKGKQTKVSEDVAVSVGETASLQQNHVIEQNHHIQVSGTTDTQTAAPLEADVNLHRHHCDGAKGDNSDETENQIWLQREASLEEKIKQLLNEKAFLDLKVRSTKDLIARLNEDNMGLQTQVKELGESRNSLVQDNQQLREHMSVMQSQIQHLEREAYFSATSTIEMTQHVSEDNDENAHMELMEAARAPVEKLIAENAELVEKVNELDIELNPGHSSTAGLDPAVGVAEATTVADYLLEFSEKMSESGERMESLASIQMKDEPIDNVIIDPTAVAPIQMEESQGSYEAGESGEIVQVSLDNNEVRGLEIQPGEIMQVPLDENEIRGLEMHPGEIVQVPLDESEVRGLEMQPGEIVQVPLDESEVRGLEMQPGEIVRVPLDENEVGGLEMQAAETDEKAGVPLSDAPLIGAPFRLISFFAKYVSGADLVSKSTLNSRQ
ncbi:hypothetical protein HHK36_018696 [Tetracentron sinense]|uniref:Uncharacterized protein n=1 Tax=Tetracentron sinense TaxID=13715 RepID=A0A834Z2N3_TETSI|nr:hypothetical protein HHK36_018696 [Tetracentron sinense]